MTLSSSSHSQPGRISKVSQTQRYQPKLYDATFPLFCSSRTRSEVQFVSTFFPKFFCFSRKNLHVMAKASRSFWCRFSSTIFCQSSGGSFPRSSLRFSASILPRKVNKSSFAPPTIPPRGLPSSQLDDDDPSWRILHFFLLFSVKFQQFDLQNRCPGAPRLELWPSKPSTREGTPPPPPLPKQPKQPKRWTPRENPCQTLARPRSG